MLLLLLSCFSHVQLCATPETTAHQASPSLGFSRQEHWSGFPFPSPILSHEKECIWVSPDKVDEPRTHYRMNWVRKRKINIVRRTDAKAESPILWPPHVKSWLIGKDSDAGRDWWAGGEGDDRGWGGWMASPTGWTWVWVNSGSWWWTGRPGVLWFMGSQRVGHDWATELNWLTYLPCSMLFLVPWKLFAFLFVYLIPSHPSDLRASITFSGKLCCGHLSTSGSHSRGTDIDTNLSSGKQPVRNKGDLGSILGLEGPPEEGKATHSSILVQYSWTI